MELDLTEYDQVEEVKFLVDPNNGLQVPASAASILVALSSGSEHIVSSSDDANCENDFVFLPSLTAATKQQQGSEQQEIIRKHAALRSQPQQIQQQQLQQASLETPVVVRQPAATRSSGPSALMSSTSNTAAVTVNAGAGFQQTAATAHPLMTLNSNSGNNNPFCQLQEAPPEGLALSRGTAPTTPLSWYRASERKHALKPIGLLDVSQNIVNSPDQLSDLMHQIVTRSDTIHIAIVCTCCSERIACPPSDIAAWLNHMNKQHNCKACPICHKLVGLGPLRDIEIMRKHVGTHFDDEWLERRTAKVNFTFGLQQQWFSSDRCNVKDSRLAGYNRNF